MTRDDVKAGDRVQAFHPHTLGVVKHGTIVTVGRKYAHIDFGVLNGGTFRVRFADIVRHA